MKATLSGVTPEREATFSTTSGRRRAAGRVMTRSAIAIRQFIEELFGHMPGRALARPKAKNFSWLGSAGVLAGRQATTGSALVTVSQTAIWARLACGKG
jgi:hypothetical protein